MEPADYLFFFPLTAKEEKCCAGLYVTDKETVS